jgi:hypothetical protein
MQKIHKNILINSSVETVWNAVVDQQKYREWTRVFTEGSYFEGDWSEGSKMYFLMTDETGKTGGMVSQIAKNDLYKFISIKHLGMVENGIEDTTSEEVKKWTPSFENYTFVVKSENQTEFVLDMDTDEKYYDEMNEMWDKAVIDLKKLCEESS